MPELFVFGHHPVNKSNANASPVLVKAFSYDEWSWIKPRYIANRIDMYEKERKCVRVCVCVCEREREKMPFFLMAINASGDPREARLKH